MKKRCLIILCITVILLLGGCGIEKISEKKTKDIDFTVVSEAELTEPVRQIVNEKKSAPFKVAYSDNEYTYIIIGYGRQNYPGYSITVKELYETSNAVCVKTEFEGPKEYSDFTKQTYPYIVIKIEYTDKNIIFSE